MSRKRISKKGMGSDFFPCYRREAKAAKDLRRGHNFAEEVGSDSSAEQAGRYGRVLNFTGAFLAATWK
jgi:hypothetical protein